MTVRRYEIQKQGKLKGWVKLVPMGTYGKAEEPPKPGTVLEVVKK